MLGPIYGTGCPAHGPCEIGRDDTLGEVSFHLDQLEKYDIPITVYHFDGWPWADAARTCTWALGDALKERLAAGHIRALMHYWGGCETEEQFDRIYAELGATLAGFYFDDGSSDEMARIAIDWAQRQMPGDSEMVMKAYEAGGGMTNAGLAAYGHSAFVNDLRSDFAGLQEGIRRVFSMANTLPAPFNEFTAYDYDFRPDEETFFRRIHFGAMQVVMDHSPSVDASPWRAGYSDTLLQDFRDFSWLHLELVPYLHSYDWNAYETGEPIFRNANSKAYTTKIGEEIFVAYVTEPVAVRPQMEIALPPGEWIDYWRPREVVSGTLTRAVPFGKEPIFIANGAMIPLDVSRDYTGHGTPASAGSLTVLVYPKAESSFRYRDDAAERWVVLSARKTAGGLTLAAAPAPSQPLLYRVERWTAAPSSVSICGTAVTVNGGAGVPAAADENAVNGSTTAAWFYDEAAARLIVKAIP
jgi:hypothetical protein